MGEKYLTRAIRTTLFAVFICQLLSTVERQVFDFLGYMWAHIIGNFFQIIVVILGLFGACQHYRVFVLVYIVWSLLWLGWNTFVICLYMEVGILNRNRESYILTFGAETKSWWLEHGIGCKITNNSWEVNPQKAAQSSRSIPPEEFVEGCIMNYYYVEVIHAAVQILLALVGLVVACVILYTYLEEEEDASSPANDELEFVKIRSRAASNTLQRSHNPHPLTTSSLAHRSSSNFDNLAFDSDGYEDSASLRRAYRPPPPGGPPTLRAAAQLRHHHEEHGGQHRGRDASRQHVLRLRPTKRAEQGQHAVQAVHRLSQGGQPGLQSQSSQHQVAGS